MKKKVVSVILTVVMMTGLVACGTADTESENTNASTVQEDTTGDNAASEDSMSDNSAANEEREEAPEVNTDLPYWILKQNFDTPGTSFEGNLFNEEAVLPLDLTVIDAYAAPYRWYPEGHSGTNVETIGEILSSDVMLSPSSTYYVGAASSTSISTQQTWTEENGFEGVSDWDEAFCGIGTIEIYNLSENEEKLPVSTCYENGWWAIAQNENNNHARLLQIAGGDGVDMADQIVEKFGTPTYVGNIYGKPESLDAWYASMEKDSIEMYSLFYEYTEFALEIYMQKHSFTDKPVVEIIGCNYYPATLWELRKSFYDKLFPIG